MTVSKPSFLVPLADLESGPRDVEWELAEAWLSRTLEGTDATPAGPGKLEARLTKNGKDVLVQGRMTARVTIPDARTLEPVALTLDTQVFLLLGPAPTDVGPKRARQRKKKPGAAPPSASKKPSRGWKDDPELNETQAGEDTYSGEEVVLDDFVREFLLLELPITVHKDLPTDQAPGIGPPSPAPNPEPEGRVDPRLAPLAAIAERLRERKN